MAQVRGAMTGDEAKIVGALQESVDFAEYEHVVLRPIFLEHISDAFGERHLEKEKAPHPRS